jgi:hypothetical protein
MIIVSKMKRRLLLERYNLGKRRIHFHSSQSALIP